MKKIQIVSFNVNGSTVTINENTLKSYKKIEGLFLTSSDDFKSAGSTTQLNIDRKEVFPKGFDTHLALCKKTEGWRNAITPYKADVDYSQIEIVHTPKAGAGAYTMKLYIHFE